MASIQKREVPEGYAAIPLTGGSDGGPRVAVLFRIDPEPIQGHFAPVGAQVDARIVLGCLLDAGGAVHQWLEIAIQDADRVVRSLHSKRGVLNNRLLDERWKSQCRAENEPPQGPLVWCGWEVANPVPVLIDPEARTAVHARDASTGGHWSLCTEDAPLEQAGLPPYSSTLHRYLWVADNPTETKFIPVTSDTPANERCAPAAQVIEGFDRFVGLNLAGGLMKARPYLSVGFEEFSEVIGGSTWQGVRHGRESMKLDHQLEKIHTVGGQENMLGDGWLFQDHHGKWGRLIETVHLKLRALADATTAVQETVRHTKTPLLNLDSESFRVRLGQFGCGLPYLWTARSELRTPGCAFALPIEATEHEYFLRTEDETSSIYRPASASAPVQGRGALRIRELAANTDELTVVTATLTTQEKIEANRNDLLWLRMELRQGHFDLFAHMEEERAMATGEIRLRTIPTKLEAETRAALQEAAGVPIDDVLFELMPLLSTPHDLYALAVLGVRTMLVDADNTLPVALDELMSLARQVGAEYEEETPLGERIAALFERDGRWLESIGPHRLTQREITPTEALDLIPADLWYDVLGLLIRMLPGMGPDSISRDFADAPIGGIHRIFQSALDDLDRLLRRTRSLIVIDWRYNREISGVLRRYATGVQGDVATV